MQIERLDRPSHGFVVAVQLVGNLLGVQTSTVGEQNLAAPQHEGVAGAQAGVQGLVFLIAQRPNKEWFAHGMDDTTFPHSCLGNALGVVFHGEPQGEAWGTGVLLEDLYGNKLYINQEPHG